MKNIQRTKTGNFRQKRADTQIKSIERAYGKDFGVRGDMKLGTFLTQNGYSSLNKLLKTSSSSGKK